MSIPETVDVETGSDPAGSVIWLHGLGADGHDFEPVVPELGLPGTLPLRFVFPHAPVRPVTINGGMAMRAWYDIVSLDRSGPADEQGIGASSEMLESLVEREIDRGVPQDRIMLAGFSQGGAIAINTIIRGNVRPAGLTHRSRPSDIHGTRSIRPDDPDAVRQGIRRQTGRDGIRDRMARLPDGARRVRGGDRGHPPLSSFRLRRLVRKKIRIRR
jgi:pimeloyl-ACP methyl ester carboxylesterase